MSNKRDFLVWTLRIIHTFNQQENGVCLDYLESDFLEPKESREKRGRPENQGRSVSRASKEIRETLELMDQRELLESKVSKVIQEFPAYQDPLAQEVKMERMAPRVKRVNLDQWEWWGLREWVDPKGIAAIYRWMKQRWQQWKEKKVILVPKVNPVNEESLDLREQPVTRVTKEIKESLECRVSQVGTATYYIASFQQVSDWPPLTKSAMDDSVQTLACCANFFKSV
jgi:hypothetical protein